MAFWSDLQNTPEPLRQYRWYIDFVLGSEEGLDKIKFALMETSKPEMEVTMTEHLLLNHYFKYPGVVKWKPLTIKWASVRGKAAEEDTSRIFQNIFYNSGYKIPPAKQDNHLNKSSFINNIAGGGLFYLNQVDEKGTIIETWNIYNPLITNINYGTLSYSSEDIVTVSATINYDFALLNSTTSET